MPNGRGTAHRSLRRTARLPGLTAVRPLAPERAARFVRLAADDAGARLSAFGERLPLPDAARSALAQPPRPGPMRHMGDEAVLTVPWVVLRGPRVRVGWLTASAGPGHLVTVGGPAEALGRLRARLIRKDPAGRPPTAATLLYGLLSAALDRVPRAIDHVDDRLAALERELMGPERRPAPDHPQTVRQLLAVKRELLGLRRALSLLRDGAGRVQRGGFTWMRAADHGPYAELYDRLLLTLENADSERDLLSSALEVHLSEVNRRMNGVMKSLTVLATLVTPLTLVTGIYGMNFAIPETQWEYGYFFALGLMAALSAGLFAFFRRRGWL